MNFFKAPAGSMKRPGPRSTTRPYLGGDQGRNAASFGLPARGNLCGATEADLGSSMSTT